MKKILVVAESIDVEDSSGSKANIALINNLHLAGFEIQVLHYTRKNIQLDNINCTAIKEKRWTPLFFLSRTERYIRYYFKIRLNNVLEKIFGFSFTLFNDRNSIISGIKDFKGFNPDYVLTLSKGGSFRPHHALLKIPELHEKWIAYIHDPYPAHLYPRPFAWVEPGYFKKWKFVRDISENAQFSAFPSKILLEWMGSYFPSFEKRGIVIPHQLNEESFRANFENSYYEDGKFTILHAGTLLGARNPTGLINAYKKLLRENPEAEADSKMIFIGNHTLFQDKFNYLKRELSEKNFVVLPYQEYEEVRALQEKVSINVILEAKSEISPFLPGKFPHCISSRRIILHLGPENSETRRLLGKDYPYWAEIDDYERILKLLKLLYKKWKDDNEDFQLIRNDLEDYLSSKNLKEIIDSLE